MAWAYVVVAVVVICTILGGVYLLYRISKPLQRKNIGNVLTLQEITRIAAIEEEMANREEQFIRQGQTILGYMQEFDQSYKRWGHAREH